MQAANCMYENHNSVELFTEIHFIFFVIHTSINTHTLHTYKAQGSYRSSVAKFTDFSSHGMTISLTLSKQ